MSRRNSDLPIWNFFKKPIDGSKTAICNYCRRELSFKTSVTNLKQHLKQKHISVYNNLIRFGKTLESTAPEKDARQERLPRIKTGGELPASPVQLETGWFHSVMPTSLDSPSVVDDDFGNQPTVKILNDSQPEKNREILTCFVSVDEDREKQNRRPNLGSRIDRPAVKDRINSIKLKDLRTEEKDEYTTYGELVAMKLKKIENSYARSTAQYHINNILYKAEIGTYNKPPRSNRSHNSKDHVTAESSTANVADDDVLSPRSSSPSKSTDYDLKLDYSDEYSS